MSHFEKRLDQDKSELLEYFNKKRHQQPDTSSWVNKYYIVHSILMLPEYPMEVHIALTINRLLTFHSLCGRPRIDDNALNGLAIANF